MGVTGCYLDANAVNPATVRAIAEVVEPTAAFVDGAIIGPPPGAGTTTVLCLAGARADEVAAVFADTGLDIRVLDGGVPAAFATVGLPSGFHDAAEATFDRLAHHKGRDDVHLTELLDDLLGALASLSGRPAPLLPTWKTPTWT